MRSFYGALILLLLAALPATAQQKETVSLGWRLKSIPSIWKRPGSLYSAGRGYAWFRAWVVIPNDWRGRKIQVFSEPIDDARQIFVNGKAVGQAGGFPPKYRSGLGSPTRFTVDPTLLRFGKPNVIALRVFDDNGRKNFNAAQPVLFGGKQAIRMQGQWEYRPGDNKKWGQYEDAPAKSEAIFRKVESTQLVERILRKLSGDIGPLSPHLSMKKLQIGKGLKLDLVASEPAVRQPLSFNWDERGRLWVVQYLQYPNPAGLKMLSRDVYLRSVYDKVPPAPPNHYRGMDKLTIHEDTDGDGIYDKHKTFIEGLSLMSSAVKGRGGVWVLNPPYLLFYPDRNDDDVPDGDPEVHLEGFGIEDSHSIANSIAWGPDGWLYACQGSTVTGNIRRPGSKKVVRSMGQLIWRYHPVRRKYEIYAEGGGNTFGLEVDQLGRFFSGTNGGNSRGFHYVQGGYYQKSFRKHGTLSNPFTFGHFANMAHHSVPRFTHTYIIYQGGALGAPYNGRLFGVGPLQGHVLYSDVQRDRSSFKTKDLGHPLVSKDPWFRPVHIKVGPDGGIYVADLYEQRIDHASHYQGRIHKESGRIYRLRGPKRNRIKPFDMGRMSSVAVLKYLNHPNRWFRMMAIRVLGDRRDRSVIPKIRQQLQDTIGVHALSLLWALNACGGLTESHALDALNHADPYVRLWTVRLLCDEERITPRLSRKIITMAQSEPSLDARSQLASSAKRLAAKPGLEVVRGLVAHSQDSSDIHIPLLLWWAIESKVAKHTNDVLRLFEDKRVWETRIVQQHILHRLMRRLAQDDNRASLLACAKLLNLAPDKPSATALMKGFEAAYQGRSLTGLPKELVDAMVKTGGGSLALRVRQGQTKALQQAISTVNNRKSKTSERARFIQLLSEVRHKPVIPFLLKIVAYDTNNAVRIAALNGLQSFRSEQIPGAVLKTYPKLKGTTQAAAQSMLATRPAWAKQLLDAVVAGKIAKDAVSKDTLKRILLHERKDLQAQVKNVWGIVRGQTSAEMLNEMSRIRTILAAGSGNPRAGKRLFGTSCGKCHVLFKQGGRIGPDLTSFKRDDVRRILLNVVNPSAEIREGYENFLIVTDDGRTLNGFVVEQDNQVVLLRNAEGQTTVIPKDEIELMKAMKQSLMPEGILAKMKDQQIRDLFAYLRATQPLP